MATYYINGKKIPLDDYKEGSKFTGSYGGAIECVGFAKLVYDQLYTSEGARVYPPGYTFSNETEAFQAFSHFMPGSRITFQSKGERPNHTMILLQVVSNGIIVYHANWDNENTVAIDKIFFEEICEHYSSVSGYHAGV